MLLINFFRQPITFLAELVPHETKITYKWYHPFNQNFNYIRSLFKIKANGWQLLRYFIFQLVLPTFAWSSF